MSSILQDVKEFNQIPSHDSGFDSVLLMDINAAIMKLTQLGVGPPGGLVVKEADEPWTSLVEGSDEYEAVKTFVCLYVKLIFDPPSSATVLEAYNKILDETEWRLREQAEGVFY